MLTLVLTSLPLSRFPASSGWSTPFSNSRNQAHWRKCRWRLSDLLGFPSYSSTSQVFLCRSLLPPYTLVPGRMESLFLSSPLRTIKVYDDVFWHKLVSIHCDPLVLCIVWEHLFPPSQRLASSSSGHFLHLLSGFFPSLSGSFCKTSWVTAGLSDMHSHFLGYFLDFVFNIFVKTHLLVTAVEVSKSCLKQNHIFLRSQMQHLLV